MKQTQGKDGKFLKKIADPELVRMVREETDIMKIYDWLDNEYKDNRTKWVELKRALFEAKTED